LGSARVNSRFNSSEGGLGGASDEIVDVSPGIDAGVKRSCGRSGPCPAQTFEVVGWDPKVKWQEGYAEVGTEKNSMFSCAWGDGGASLGTIPCNSYVSWIISNNLFLSDSICNIRMNLGQ
jgi:hypothetical protein